MNKIYLILSCTLLMLMVTLGSACRQSAVGTTNPAVNSVLAASPAPSQNPEDVMPRLSVQEAKAAYDKGDAVLVDVRGIDAYEISHIKGAIDHALSKLEQGDFKDLPKDKRIIAYCSCPTEHSSARAALVLQKAGFKDAAALVGGNMAWEAAGYEMIKSSSTNIKTPQEKPEIKASTKKK